MNLKPVLLLQLHRLGDIILTFPLLEDLRQTFPGAPLGIVAQAPFAAPLSPLLPGVEFFAPSQLPRLATSQYAAILNLSSAPAAAAWTSRAKAEIKLGAIAGNGTHIEGYWQLYRAALTQNNRHNAFHWSDLYRMDLAFPLHMRHKPPQICGNRRIGLFIGASDAAKRPGIPFWSALGRQLLAGGYTPVLLGGPEEKAMGEQIAGKLAAANFCGKTSLAQLAAIIRSLDLLITPDTGPMHLADWLGVPVLNLSMGYVHALETGPSSPGQTILRANMSCVGCWSCTRGKLYCKNAFNPMAVARMAAGIADGGKSVVPAIPGLETLRSARDENGLYTLEPAPGNSITARQLLENFWKCAFLLFNQQAASDRLSAAAKSLELFSPRLVWSMHATFSKMLASLASAFRAGAVLDDDFWRMPPAHSRIFAGHTQMSLQNGNFSHAAWRQALDRAALLAEVFSGHK